MTENVQFINGEWNAGSGPVFQSINPSNDETIWQGAAADATQVQFAVSSAREAFEAWSESSFEARINVINRFAELLSDNTEQLATIIAKETGKALWESKTEIGAMVGKIAISVKAYHQRTGSVENVNPTLTSKLRHKPHGVVAIFGPYNFPGHLPNGHIVPALIAGNTIVFKPSDLTPYVGQEMIKLWQQAGLPQGVLNLVQGKVETGKALASHADIDGLFFTGSSTTGHLLHEQFAGHPGKILALEMGGNNPLIVKDVNNIDAAVHDIVQSAFVTTGQRCTCARRLFIEDTPNGDAILAKLITVTKSLKIDQPFAQEQPFFGAMISKEAAAGMVAAQQEIVNLGGQVLVELQQKNNNRGFVTPGIIDVTNAKPLPDIEHFGPLLKIYRYKEFDQAIIESNNTEFGLSAGFIGDNESDYNLFFKRIRAGIVNWNKPTTGASSAAPFGGIGASGNHRASAFYAADYCAYPVASVEASEVTLPATLAPGINI